jgi:TfoX/Sxy family transcriptional regulator of competence genes
MPFDPIFVQQVREVFSAKKVKTEEKKMMGGLTFMVKGKMCVGVLDDELMARIDPELYESSLKKKGCRPMDFTGKPMKGYVFINKAGTKNPVDLDYWISLALDFNKRAKASPKKKKTAKKAVKKSK